MRKIVITAMVAVCSVAVANAQGNAVKVGYQEETPTFGTVKRSPYTDMVLVASPEASFYYNTHSQYVDSLNSTPEGRKNLREIMMATAMSKDASGNMTIDLSRPGVPIKTISTFVSKDFQNGNIRNYGKVARDNYYYDEPIDEMQWNIVDDSTKTVLGYECVMAETDYHGRHWKAWFAPEVPLRDGPWKLRGLPGLILEAHSGSFGYVAKGIEKYEGKMPAVYSANEYIKTDRKKFLADYLHVRLNADSMAKAMGATKVVHVDENGNEVEAPKYEPNTYMREIDFLEKDSRK